MSFVLAAILGAIAGRGGAMAAILLGALMTLVFALSLVTSSAPFLLALPEFLTAVIGFNAALLVVHTARFLLVPKAA